MANGWRAFGTTWLALSLTFAVFAKKELISPSEMLEKMETLNVGRRMKRDTGIKNGSDAVNTLNSADSINEARITLSSAIEEPIIQSHNPSSQLPPHGAQGITPNGVPSGPEMQLLIPAAIPHPQENADEMLGDFVPSVPGSPNYRYIRPDYMQEDKVNAMLLLHNRVRSSVAPSADQMLKMSWDYDLEANAWRYTQKCQFSPSYFGDRRISSFPRVGENLWVSWGMALQTFRPENVIATWMKEQKYFDASLRSCVGGACERYVQMIWSMSYKIGCAWSWCENINVYGFHIQRATFLACHYGPGRTDAPFIPYYHGLTCSFCDSADKCEHNLCANIKRDEITGQDPFPTEPPTTAPLTTTTRPLSEEAKIALIVVGSLVGCTLVLTIAIHLGVRLARRRAEGRLSDYFKSIPRRLSLWYDSKHRNQEEFNNTEMGEQDEDESGGQAVSSHSKASIVYHANLWNN